MLLLITVNDCYNTCIYWYIQNTGRNMHNQWSSGLVVRAQLSKL